ncbi:DMT family transporter [Desulfovibrio sp. X2]|uniref:DMT family transporter n=1 Tax=Desulfovibrio sp. X2 TaxID=941449 RepID=UPI001F1DD638|nr:DMT family transporter [Desulfovibrio sp. X2]
MDPDTLSGEAAGEDAATLAAPGMPNDLEAAQCLGVPDAESCAPDVREDGRWAPILWLLAGSVCISFSPVLVKVASIGPIAAAFYRMFFGGAALALPLLVRGGLRGERGGLLPARGESFSLGLALVCALAFCLDLSCWHTSIRLVGPGMATILGNSQVVFLAVYGVVFLGERGIGRLVASLVLAAAGIGLLFGPDWAVNPGESRAGLLFGLATAVSYAVFLITLRRMQTAQGFTARLRNMALLGLLAAALLGLGVAFSGESFAIPGLVSLLALLAYGVICQGAGWMLISSNLPRVPLSTAGLAILLQPTLSFVWDVLFFGRRAGPMDILGAALALCAIFLGATRRK